MSRKKTTLHTKDTSFYTVLGIEKTATAAEIKSGYRKAALQWHPDRAVSRGIDKDVSTEQFKLVAAAFGCLSDAEKRAGYDRWGHDGGVGNSNGGGGGGGGVHFQGGSQVDADEIFRAFFGGMQGMQGGMGNGVHVRSFSFGGGPMRMSGGAGGLNEIFRRMQQQVNHPQHNQVQNPGTQSPGQQQNVASFDCSFFFRMILFCWVVNFLFFS
jgi:DnaJ-class molecular chaperone